MNREQVIREIRFSFSRSGGPGGQHANKVATKVQIALDLENSMAFSEAEKQRLLRKLEKKLSAEGELRMSCDSTRSQGENKRIVLERLLDLLEEKLKMEKRRVPTKTPRSVKEKRLDKKRQQAYKKAMRRKPKQD